MAKDVIMPALGMAQETGTLLEWLKCEGDEVKKGEPLMLVETDKTSVEIEAPASGRLVNVEIQAGDEVPVGTRVALLIAEGESVPELLPPPPSTHSDKLTDSPAKKQLSATPLARAIAAKESVDLSALSQAGKKVRKLDVLAAISSACDQSDEALSARDLASPKARRLAREQDIELSQITGSGPGGAVLASDVTSYGLVQAVLEEGQQPKTSRVWKVMARRLTQSWQEIPHFYLNAEAAVGELESWRQRLQTRTDIKITMTDLISMVTARALRSHPKINGSWVDGAIRFNQSINIGLAVAVDDGLQVPVITNADSRSITELATVRKGLIDRARSDALTIADVSDGTFTISNLGMFGTTSFSAIVNPPQAAILAVGSSQDKVVPRDGQICVEKRMELTLSCDHRVIDGATGARFLDTLVELIEEPLALLD